VLPTERIAYLGRGVRLLRCGISNQLMSQMGQNRVLIALKCISEIAQKADLTGVSRHVSNGPTVGIAV